MKKQKQKQKTFFQKIENLPPCAAKFAYFKDANQKKTSRNTSLNIMLLLERDLSKVAI